MFKSANALQNSHFVRHAKFQKHLSAKSDVMQDFRTAPTSEEFKTVLVNFKEGRSSGKMQRWKLRKMKFCLAEAERERVRRLIRMAKSVADGHTLRAVADIQF